VARRTLAIAGPLVVAGAVAALAAGAAFQHYLRLAFVPVALAAGGASAALWMKIGAGTTRRVVVAAIALSTCWLAGRERLGQWRSRDWAGYVGPAQIELRDRMDELDPRDGRSSSGASTPISTSRRDARPPRGSSAPDGSSGASPGPFPRAAARPGVRPRIADLFLRDFDAARPVFVVDSAGAGVHGFTSFPIGGFPELEERLGRDYVPETLASGYVLWRRQP